MPMRTYPAPVRRTQNNLPPRPMTLFTCVETSVADAVRRIVIAEGFPSYSQYIRHLIVNDLAARGEIATS